MASVDRELGQLLSDVAWIRESLQRGEERFEALTQKIEELMHEQEVRAAGEPERIRAVLEDELSQVREELQTMRGQLGWRPVAVVTLVILCLGFMSRDRASALVNAAADVVISRVAGTGASRHGSE